MDAGTALPDPQQTARPPRRDGLAAQLGRPCRVLAASNTYEHSTHAR
jgi:hypothetical protein